MAINTATTKTALAARGSLAMMCMMPRCFQYRDKACCLLASSNQYRYHTTTLCDLAESRGFLGGKRESGKDSRVVSNGLSARTAATAMPNQTCVTVREPRLLPCVNRAAGIP